MKPQQQATLIVWCFVFASPETTTISVALIIVVLFSHDWYLVALVICSLLLALEFF
jgi:hypothetical protein